ncbi:hypothetical protein TIFTF001_001522 [Ficus carica]|uniref:AAA+ ATPase domain-containing protein n=1 Tax=Ficus carica TaxID=3494 RepID=A0AA87Z0F5_FICCA|nr:hypothetical protein TIFTF001_001522 [Ficus carica]
MAEVNISFVVERILEMLGSAALKESAKKVWKVADEFEELERTISTVRAFLLDVDQLQPQQQEGQQVRVQRTLEKLETAVYETDEFVEACFALASGRTSQATQVLTEVMNFFTTSTDYFVFRLKMLKKMKQVMKALAEASSALAPIIEESDRDRMQESGRDNSSCLFDVENPKNEVIGRDFDVWKIMDLVLEEEYSHHHHQHAADSDPAVQKQFTVRVIPVVGAQGMGKTTLVKVVYNEAKVADHFDPRLWVNISDLVDVRFIVHKLIHSAKSEEETPTLDLNLGNNYPRIAELQKQLQQAINGKRFLLVLDGLRDKDQQLWLTLRNLLMAGAAAKEGSTVLLTTRSETVANITGTAAGSHHLGPLDDEDSWPLLKREAFSEMDQEQLVAGEAFQTILEETGRQIAEKCLGVPFVILDVGKTLCGKPVREWKQVELKETITKARLVREMNSATKDEVIGRDTDKKAIIDELLEHSSKEDKLVIYTIRGPAGVGKTALARLIFNDSQVQNHFDLRIWVSVSNDFDLIVIMEKILVSLTGERPQADELENRIRQEILRKRHLLILDDVQNLDDANRSALEGLLDVGANGSKVVVTTTIGEDATSTEDKPPGHSLERLDKNSSWSLFVKVAFENGLLPANSKILKIAEEIEEKCGGIPLLIRRIGEILYLKDEEADWSSFHENELEKMLKKAEMPEFASSGYDHLPYFLRPCIVYCGLFPNGYEIDTQTLVNLWISQGFLRTSSDSNLEDVGYGYLEELVRRSFFKEIKRDELGRITKCKVQDFICELTRLKASNAYATLHINGEMNGKTPRHVSYEFHLDSSWHVRKLAQSKKFIQTLILPLQSQWEVEERSSEAVCIEVSKFKSLRMLDLHNSGIKEVSDSIGDLRHMRYLDLSHNVNIRELPKSIGKLQNLQTLKLNHCSNLKKLPKTIKNLVNLRNLENKSCYSLTHIPRGLGQLTKLRTLSEFVLCKDTGSVSKKSGNLQELEKLDELRGKLKIKNLGCLGGDDASRAKLTAKKHLVDLDLIWNVNAAIDADDYVKLLEALQPREDLRELSLFAYGGEKFSSWLPHHAKLVKFTLSRCMKCQSLPPLDHLPCLEVLLVDDLPELKYAISKETSGDESYSKGGAFFKSLTELQLTNLPNLTRWWEDEVKASEFPCLSKLIIGDCPNLISMPLFPVVQVLVLKNTKWKPFQETLASSSQIPSTSSSTSSAVRPLSGLRTLSIINMTSANGGSNMFWSLPSLHSFTIDHVREIEPFLEGLDLLKNLQELHIWRCASLETISWIRNIKSLRILSVKLCPKLTIPREEIRYIHDLQDAVIQGCPKVSHVERMLEDPLYKTHNPNIQ